MGRKILIIDESEEIHEKLGKFFEEKGYEVYHSFDGEDGINNIFKIVPDCVILEILLPKKIGIEIVRECKINPKLQKIAFIFYTILYLKEEEIKRGIFLKGNFYSFNVDAYFQKPTQPEIILNKIKEILEEKKEEKEIRNENLLILKIIEMNHFLIDLYFKKEEIEKKLSSIEKEVEKKFLKKIEEINEKYFNLKENIVLIKNDMDLLIKNFEETLSDIREKFYNLKPEEEKFPEKVRELTGKIREGLQKIEALIYKIKDKIYKL
jgi:DNA-binding response OmpR family regulator